MNSSVPVILSLVLIIWSVNTFSLPFTGACESCGRECRSACGTRGFRTCCLNYLKKRSTPVSVGSDIKLRLLMVFPELAQYYPSLRCLAPEKLNPNQLNTLFEKPDLAIQESHEGRLKK